MVRNETDTSSVLVLTFRFPFPVARQTYKETTNDIHQLITTYGEQFGIPLKPHFSPTTGYQICCQRDRVNKDELPMMFTNVVVRKKQLFFTTLDLKKYNER
jgi:DNA mismatch repair protein MSH4